ncbi:MAG TPA: YdcF family protein [Candidatus Saccharimonadales bacterium]
MPGLKTIIFLALFGAAVFGLYQFTHVDDLKHCGAQPSASINGCQKADAIVAISGGDTKARARTAIELYHNGWADKIILSGAARDTSGPSNAMAMRQQALQAGVREQDIYTDEFAQNTNQNALGVLEVARLHSLNTIILVTSPYHQARASVMFHKAFDGYGTVRNHSTPYDSAWSEWWWMTLGGWVTLVGELISILFEKMRPL